MPYRIQIIHNRRPLFVPRKFYFLKSECDAAVKSANLHGLMSYSYHCIDVCFCELARKRLWRDIKRFRWFRFKRKAPFILPPLSLSYGIKTIIEDIRYDFNEWRNGL